MTVTGYIAYHLNYCFLFLLLGDFIKEPYCNGILQEFGLSVTDACKRQIHSNQAGAEDR